MGNPSQTTNKNEQSASNQIANQSQQIASGTNTGTTYGSNTGSNTLQTYAPSALGQQYLAAGTAPAASGISQYFNPYQQQVINATMGQLGQQWGQMQQGILGNAISQNALGGDREALAQQAGASQFANQVAAPTLAGLNTQGFNTALGASQADLARQLQAAGLAGGTTAGQQLGTTLGGQLSSTLGNVNLAAQNAGSTAGNAQGTSTTTTNPGLLGYGSLALGLLADGGAARQDGGPTSQGDGGLSQLMQYLSMLHPQAPALPQMQMQQPKPQQQSPSDLQKLGTQARGGLSNLFGGSGAAPEGKADFGGDILPYNSGQTGFAGLGNRLSNDVSSVGDVLGFDSGGTVSAPNVSAPNLSAPTVSAPNVRVPQFYQPPSGGGKGSGMGMPGGMFGDMGGFFGGQQSQTPQASSQGQVTQGAPYNPYVYAPMPSAPMPSVASGGAIRRADGGEGTDPFSDVPVNTGVSAGPPQEAADVEPWGPQTPGGQLGSWISRNAVIPGSDSDSSKVLSGVLHGLLGGTKPTTSEQAASTQSALATKGTAGMTGSPSANLLTEEEKQAGLSPSSLTAQPTTGGFSPQNVPLAAPAQEATPQATTPQAAQPPAAVPQAGPQPNPPTSILPPQLRGRQSVAQLTADTLRQGGASENAVAGILANVNDESGFNPGLRHPDQPKWGGEAHYAHGLFQEGGQEWNNYVDWLHENAPNGKWGDPKLQTQFLVQNLKDNYPKVWDKMNNGTREEAAQAFVSGYLKPAKQYELARRNQYASGVPVVEDIINGISGGLKSVSQGAEGAIQSIKGTLQKGFDNSGQQPQQGYQNQQDQQHGGLLQRLFGINFNPLNLSDKERTGLMRMGATMMQTGNAGSGINAYLNAQQSGNESDRQAHLDAMKLEMERAKLLAPIKGPKETDALGREHEGMIQFNPTTNRYESFNPGSVAATTSQNMQHAAQDNIPSDVHGADFVKAAGLNANDEALIKSMSTYSMPLEQFRRASNNQQLMAMVERYDPNFDAKEYKARQGLIDSFKSKKDADEIKSYNTLMGHVARFDQNIDALGNYTSPAVNTVRNAVRGQYDKGFQQASGRVHTDLDTAIAEYNRATTGKPITVDEGKRWHEMLSENSSPETMHAVSNEMMHLVESRMEATAQKWNKGFNIQPGDPGYRTGEGLLDPKPKALYNQVLGRGAASRTQAVAAQAAPSGPPPNMSHTELKSWAMDAISKGADPKVVQQRLQTWGIQ